MSIFGCVTVVSVAGVTKVTSGGRAWLGGVEGGEAGGGVARWTVSVAGAEATRSAGQRRPQQWC